MLIGRRRQELADTRSSCVNFPLAGRFCCWGDWATPRRRRSGLFRFSEDRMRHEVHQSSALEYLSVYPESYQDGAAYPLLIWLHAGCTPIMQTRLHDGLETVEAFSVSGVFLGG